MSTENKTSITVDATVNAPIEKVWKCWTDPADIIQWCFASDDWCAPHAENDLRKGGSFMTRMESKDGKIGFDFGGVYDDVRNHELIAYTMGDGRQVKISFTGNGNQTHVVETFDPENMHSHEMQRAGWQAILDNFKKHAENI